MRWGAIDASVWSVGVDCLDVRLALWHVSMVSVILLVVEYDTLCFSVCG